MLLQIRQVGKEQQRKHNRVDRVQSAKQIHRPRSLREMQGARERTFGRWRTQWKILKHKLRWLECDGKELKMNSKAYKSIELEEGMENDAE